MFYYIYGRDTFDDDVFVIIEKDISKSENDLKWLEEEYFSAFDFKLINGGSLFISDNGFVSCYGSLESLSLDSVDIDIIKINELIRESKYFTHDKVGSYVYELNIKNYEIDEDLTELVTIDQIRQSFFED